MIDKPNTIRDTQKVANPEGPIMPTTADEKVIARKDDQLIDCNICAFCLDRAEAEGWKFRKLGQLFGSTTCDFCCDAEDLTFEDFTPPYSGDEYNETTGAVIDPYDWQKQVFAGIDDQCLTISERNMGFI